MIDETPALTPLGRGVVVNAPTPVPAPWADCEVVVIDDVALVQPARVVASLAEAWSNRRPVVVELRVDPATFRAPESITGDVWSHTPATEPWFDRLHFLVWANNYDARGDAPVWWWSTKASRIAPDSSVIEPGGGVGDLRLADGRVAWVDGGPRRPWSADDIAEPVIHAESVELGTAAVTPVASEPTADLAPDQLEAVSHVAGPARIIAPAGSGKTRVLTERLRHLVVDRGYEPRSVLAVAYNKQAQLEMEGRTTDFQPHVRTLNSLGLWVLARHRGSSPPVVDEREVRRLVDTLLPGKRMRRANTDPIGPYIEGLGAIRLGLRDPEEVEASRDDVDGLAEMFPVYRARLADKGVVDFDEQIYAAIETLLRDGAFRRDMQRSCRHLLVDEFQDLTPAHVVLLRLVAGPALDVFGVGDDDQVIYGHAGADPRFLIDFASWFPGGGEHALEVNHRCAGPIVEAASTLLGYNQRRVAKVIRSRADAPAGPEALRITTHPSSGGAEALVATVRGWLEDDGAALDHIAVLARVHALLLAPHVALVEAGIGVRSTIGPELLERTGARAALAYLRIAAEPAVIAPEDLAEVYRRPSRGLPRWITKWFRRPMTVAEVAAIGDRIDDVKVAEKITALVADLGIVAGAGGGTTRQALETIRDRIGLGEAMAGLDRSKGGEGSSQLDDLEALLQVADLHPTLDGFEAWLRSCLAAGRARGPAVTLSTVHRVKGREWPRVVVTGVTAGLLPHRLAADEEEERRILHVAITRARDAVVVLGDESRPSPFLGELTGVAPVRPAEPPGRHAPGPSTDGRADRRRREGGRAAPGEGLTGEDAVREEALRGWRRERSRSDGVPAYVVASDATLRAIVQRAPTTSAELATVAGIGPAKLTRYGPDILALLAEPISDAPDEDGRPRTP